MKNGNNKMIIVDTNILIGIQRGEALIKTFFEQNLDEEFYISAISMHELYIGLGYIKITRGLNIYKKNKQQLDSIINDFYLIDLSEEIIKQAGIKEGELIGKGITIDTEDIIIGVTAEIFKADKIISKNKKHFKYFDVNCESI
jgi:predicted nucleic acid-binding protein